jgi:hypothetical protein
MRRVKHWVGQQEMQVASWLQTLRSIWRRAQLRRRGLAERRDSKMTAQRETIKDGVELLPERYLDLLKPELAM